jgi:hypothetical protein
MICLHEGFAVSELGPNAQIPSIKFPAMYFYVRQIWPIQHSKFQLNRLWHFCETAKQIEEVSDAKIEVHWQIIKENQAELVIGHLL